MSHPFMSYPFQVRIWNECLKEYISENVLFRDLNQAIVTAQQLIGQDDRIKNILVYDVITNAVRWQAPHFERYVVMAHNPQTDQFDSTNTYPDTLEALSTAMLYADKLVADGTAESARVYDRQTQTTVYDTDPIPF